jgi:hypothetical protein
MSSFPILNLPEATLKIRKHSNGHEVFDPSRKRYVKLTAEEWVRQHFLSYLVNALSYPLVLVSVEKGILVNGRVKRFDMAVFDKKGLPVMLIECKAPNVSLGQDAVDQVGRYNLALKVPFLVVTNGIAHICCRREPAGTWSFLDHIPPYADIS